MEQNAAEVTVTREASMWLRFCPFSFLDRLLWGGQLPCHKARKQPARWPPWRGAPANSPEWRFPGSKLWCRSRASRSCGPGQHLFCNLMRGPKPQPAAEPAETMCDGKCSLCSAVRLWGNLLGAMDRQHSGQERARKAGNGADSEVSSGMRALEEI